MGCYSGCKVVCLFFKVGGPYVGRSLFKCGVIRLYRFGGERYYFPQSIDYLNIPFRCVHCHKYGHVVANCNYYFSSKIWLRKYPNEEVNAMVEALLERTQIHVLSKSLVLEEPTIKEKGSG